MELQNLLSGLNQAAEQIHGNNKAKGFWDNPRNTGELLMLVVSELGEAMEAHRKNRFALMWLFEEATNSEIAEFKDDFEIHIKDTFEDEIADAIIRLLDMCSALNIDIEKHIYHKVEYNKTRERLHGKAY